MFREKRIRLNPKIDHAQIEAEVMELCHQHIASLSRYAASLTKQRSVIHGSMREVFQRYFFTRMGGGNVDNPRVWLARALRDCVIARLRKASMMLDLDSGSHAATFRRKEEAADDQDRAFRLALASLSERERECLQLRIEGFVFSELAHIMQIRRGTVGSLLSRALTNFREAEAMERRPHDERRNNADTYNLISQMRLALAETQYQRRIQRRIWTYVFALGLLTAAAALATVLMK